MTNAFDMDRSVGVDLSRPLDGFGLGMANRAGAIGAPLGRRLLALVVTLDVPLVVVLAHGNTCSVYLSQTPCTGPFIRGYLAGCFADHP